MIYKSGKEIKEIYIGDTPVTAVYIGSKLVWRSYVYFKTAGTVLYIPQSDAELLKSQGITYIPEANVLPLTAHVSPYMRHISPMTAADQVAGNAEGQIKVSHSEISKVIGSELPLHNANAVSSKCEENSTSHIGSAVHENSVTHSPGDVMRFTANGSPISEVNITGGEGEAPRDAYISESVGCVPIVPGDGEMVRPAHVSNAQAAVNPANADGNPDNAGGYITQSFQTVGKVLNNSVDFIKCAKEWTAQAKVKVGYAETEKYREESYMIQTCAVSSETGAADVTETQGVCVSSGDVTAKVGSGKSTSDSGTIFGMCSASVTTEIYTEPVPSSFDSSMVSELDGLAIEDIDAMSVSV